MTAAELMEEFKPVERGSHRRIELQEHISDSSRYFPEPITLPTSSEVVRISREWGDDQWDIFKNHMEKHGYSIMQYRILNINDSVQRRWEHCQEYKFVSAGGDPRYHTGMKNLKKGDLLFVCRIGENLPLAQRGCVAFCRVISEQAIDVWDIQTSKGKLGDIPINNGQTYYDTFCKDRKFPDKASEVKWIRLRENSPVKTNMHPGFCVSRITTMDFNNLTDAFNIRRTDSKK